MTAHAEVIELNENEHPALLLARAHELLNEADELYERVKELRMESARLRSRADRYRDGTPMEVRPKREKPDRLLAAAALAVEDLPRVFSTRDLGEALQVRDMARATKLLHALAKMDLVMPVGEDWRAQDPEEARVRDALRELGTCSREQLAGHLERPVEALATYLDDGERRNWVHVMEDGHLMYLKPGPERVITRHPKQRPPEKEPPAGLDAPKRGEPVLVVDHGKRGQQGSVPGQRHRLKLKDARRSAMEQAREKRASEQRAKAAAKAPGAQKKKRATRGVRTPRAQ